ncbi:MAG: nicotinate phosphoribosyltransferase [Chloroflexi bacterium]|nr:nicotinate phosphoribosyltransferase [Chloroflexota bacterium]
MPHRELSTGLFADLYEITMAQAYRQSGTVGEATFSLFFRSYPPDRAYFVFAGLEDVLEHLEHFGFSEADLDYLRSTGQFAEDFVDFLRDLRFTGSVRAMKEGTLFFIDEPVIEVTAPMIEAQFIETFLVNQINLQTILATKSSRVVHAARGRTVVDFAARRTHGIEAANALARASYMVGFAGTSNVMAGGMYGIPTFGTMAHSFVTSFDHEEEAFRSYADSFPDTSTFLVDTYDSIEGTRRAANVGKEMRQKGHRLRAIRLDSGDLGALAWEARRVLDEVGMDYVDIFASGGLDEFEVESLLRDGAPIDGFGVGTKVGVSADAPWTDCAYKLVEYDGRPVLKLSPDKQTLPAPKQVYRLRDSQGFFLRDVIACASEPGPSGDAEPLLELVMTRGKQVAAGPPLADLREHFATQFKGLPADHKRLRAPSRYDVEISEELARLQARVVGELRARGDII